MAALIVLAVIAAVLTAVLLIPIKIYVDYHGSFRLWMKVLFLRFDFFPRKTEKVKKSSETAPSPARRTPKADNVEPPEENAPEPEQKKPTPRSAPEKEKDEPRTKKTVSEEKTAETEEAEETVGFVDRFLRYYYIFEELFAPFRRALRLLLRIDELNVSVRAGTQDAAMTAIYTGMLWGVTGGLLGLVTSFFTIKKQSIEIAPAYNETVLYAEGDCIIRTNAANIIGAAAIAALAYLKFKRKNRRNKK